MAERIECSVEYVDLENDQGRMIPSVRVRCGQCDHETESFGTSARSVRRCLMLLKEECPEGEGDNHYYHADEAD